MLYIIGLGLNVEGISVQGLEILKRCKKIYLENYTVDFPYSEGELNEKLGLKKLYPADREFIESEKIVDEAKKMDVALLVYGSPLTATTHISLINEAKRLGIKCKVIYSASIIDAVAETGLQLYKFGKVTSIPKFEAESFMEVIKENNSINAHTLILADIGLDFQDALEKLKTATANHNFKLEKIIVCQRLGTKNSKIFYKNIKDFEEFTGVRSPFCFIIPGKLHFLEREYLNGF